MRLGEFRKWLRDGAPQKGKIAPKSKTDPKKGGKTAKKCPHGKSTQEECDVCSGRGVWAGMDDPERDEALEMDLEEGIVSEEAEAEERDLMAEAEGLTAPPGGWDRDGDWEDARMEALGIGPEDLEETKLSWPRD